ncbi:replication-associated recombination protein A [Micrococcoides hystricis]|uniref:Replication-associated recombination protein A n=1 Tax=Micrococcoides hystricis TaxID=1572761 RepID=A0ABV6P9P4_9MICC
MRPRTIDEVVGQQHLLKAGSPLRQLATGTGKGPAGLSSVILYGPPGTGKTTLAHVLAAGSDRKFVELSAITSGIKDVRAVMDQALLDRDLYGRTTILFLDEIHRFNKAQQDALLPGVENGWIVLVAATTENPSFSVVSPLLSRSLMLTLKPLTDDDIAVLLQRALESERGLNNSVTISADAQEHLVRTAQGDARRALTALEAAAAVALEDAARSADHSASAQEPEVATQAVDEDDAEAAEDTSGHADVPFDVEAEMEAETETPQASQTDSSVPEITLAHAEQALNQAVQRYDKDGDQHYDVVSAFIKSMRGSDPDAALHYLARMLEAGEDPRFVARRIMICASEDVGMADPQALQVAVAAAQSVQLVGMPEARIMLAQAVVHIATAPKSNASYMGINKAIADVRAGKGAQVPPHLRDAHYPGAKALGHGKGYKYSHDYPHSVSQQQYLPDDLQASEYYVPTTNGFERELNHRVELLRQMVRGQQN